MVVDDECFSDGHAAEVLDDIRACVAEHFPVSVQHSTFQIETDRISEREPRPGTPMHEAPRVGSLQTQ